jgi:hypothetical protein
MFVRFQAVGRNLWQAKKIQVEANFFLCACTILAWRTRRGGHQVKHRNADARKGSGQDFEWNYLDLNSLQEITTSKERPGRGLAVP